MLLLSALFGDAPFSIGYIFSCYHVQEYFIFLVFLVDNLVDNLEQVKLFGYLLLPRSMRFLSFWLLI